MTSSTSPIPVLLLKTKSTPGDSYEEAFSEPTGNGRYTFEPTFVPVLLHKFQDDGLATVRDLLKRRAIGPAEDASYGGLIFTSQRAVEAFSSLVSEGSGSHDEWPHLQSVPFYSVGPATTRALKSIPPISPHQIHGSHTGNGEALASFILDHYTSLHALRNPKPPLLFLVGEQRRDIIPRTLTSPSLPPDQRIPVTEVPVYGTGVMDSFPEDFRLVLQATTSRPVRWVVVFSPTGCESMLSGLGMLDEVTRKAKKLPPLSPESAERSTFVATIGPTTRDYLRRTFDLEPDVCAEQPTPEGVLRGITDFLDSRQT